MTTWVPIGEDLPVAEYSTQSGSIAANTPGKLDLLLVKGVNNSVQLKFPDIDITNYTFAAPVADVSTEAVVLSFTVAKAAPNITLSLTKAQITTLMLYSDLKWDLDVTVGGVESTWFTGKVSFINAAS